MYVGDTHVRTSRGGATVVVAPGCCPLSQMQRGLSGDVNECVGAFLCAPCMALASFLSHATGRLMFL